ncbi:MAG: ATP-binding protein [Chloroflexota bacterium]
MMPSVFKHYYPRVNTRITAPFLLVTMIVAGLGVFIVTQLVSSSITERLNNQLLSSSQAARNAMVEIESEQLAALRALVFTEGIPDAIASNDVETLADRIAPIVLNNQLDAVVIFDTASTPIYSIGYDDFTSTLAINPVPEGASVAGIERVLQVEVDEQGDKFVDVVPVDDDYLFFITAPVVNDSNFIVGGIAIGFRASGVIRRLTEQALANLVIYDEQGRVLATSFRNDREALSLSNGQVQSLWQAVDDASPYREITVQEIPYRSLYTGFDFRSEQIGLLAVALPTDFVIEQIGISRNAFIFLFGVLFVVVVAIGLVVARSIVQPINKLVDTTRAIQGGDLSRRVELNQPDEIGELGHSFDRMTERLIARNQEVEDLYTQQLEETARRDAILSSITDAVIVRGRDGNIVMMNPAAEALLQELQPYPDLLHEFTHIRWHAQQEDKVQSLSFGRQHYSVVATPVYNRNQEIIGYVIVYRDISRLIQAEKLKDEMILQLSHELRTPLTSVRGYIELMTLLNHAPQNQEGDTFVDKALGQLVILERMVNQVIDVSALLADHLDLELELFDLADLVEEVLATNQPFARQRYQRITGEAPPTAMLIDGDRRQLYEVIDHILRNAISYTPEGGHIRVTLDFVDSQFVEIVVMDNGKGIAPDELPLVFDRLYRGRSAEAGETDTRGLGLGLFMSREIVHAHQGRISIDSAPDKGTIVSVELPIKQELVSA